MGDALIVRKGGGATEDAWGIIGAPPSDITGAYGKISDVSLALYKRACHAFTGYQTRGSDKYHYIETQNGWELSVVPPYNVITTEIYNGELYLGLSDRKIYKFDGEVFTNVCSTPVGDSSSVNSLKLVAHRGELYVFHRGGETVYFYKMKGTELISLPSGFVYGGHDGCVDVDGVLYAAYLYGDRFKLHKFDDTLSAWTLITSTAPTGMYGYDFSLINYDGKLIISQYKKAWELVGAELVGSDTKLGAQPKQVAYGSDSFCCFFCTTDSDINPIIGTRIKILRRN